MWGEVLALLDIIPICFPNYRLHQYHWRRLCTWFFDIHPCPVFLLTAHTSSSQKIRTVELDGKVIKLQIVRVHAIIHSWHTDVLHELPVMPSHYVAHNA